MSFRVLIIPEDFQKDQYILKPIFDKMFETLGRKAKVIICREPRLRGVQEALDWRTIEAIVERYRAMIDCFVLVVDRDGQEGRRNALDQIEQRSETALSKDKWFFGENAWQEVEVWLLAGHDLPADWAWKQVRVHENPKEAYYEHFARARGVFDGPAQGRVTLGREAATRYRRIRQLCSEVGELETRIGAISRRR